MTASPQLAAARPQVSLNQATLETSSTLDLLDACVAAGIDLVAPWRHKYLQGSATTTKQALDDHGVTASSLCRGGFFTGNTSGQQAQRDNRSAVEEAAQLGAPVLVLVCGPIGSEGAGAALSQIERGVEELLPHAIEHGITLALEAFHPMFAAERSAIVRLDQATQMADRIDHANLGVAVDIYHVWWDPDLDAALQRAASRITSVHVADWLVPTTSLLAGRGLPGDGIIDLPHILRALSANGYSGPVEVEVLNAEVWDRPPREVAVDVIARMNALLTDSWVAA
jgi:sugar phosphate isomerase/epimerase